MARARYGGGEAFEGWASNAAIAGSRGDLRRGHAHRGGEDRRGDAAGRSRLGAEVQRAWAGRSDRLQGAWAKNRG